MRNLTTPKSASPDHRPMPGQTLLTATVTSDGAGGFRVVPAKPVQEIGSAEAARLLSMSRGSLSLTVDTALGQKHLRWRWLTPKKGKRLFELASVVEYREALKGLE
jgi:hypothetical protein